MITRSSKGKTSPLWLRMLEVSVGLIILVLGVVLWWPGLQFGTAFFAALAIGLIILEIGQIIRIFAKGISAEQRAYLFLSVLAILIAVGVLAVPSFDLVDLLATGLLFAGIASVAYGTASSEIVGILDIFITVAVLMSPQTEGVLAFLATPIVLLFPDFTYPEIPAALVTLSLMILALEPLISGIKGTLADSFNMQSCKSR